MSVKKFLSSLTTEKVEELNRLTLNETNKQHQEFIDNFKNGICYLCGLNITCFNHTKPCFHWFLRPNGIKKKYFNKYLQTKIGFFNLDCYLRWVANSSIMFKNINDLKSESSLNKVLEYTIKYKNIEWTFSISENDKLGHKGTNSDYPHFHLQMKTDGQIFLKFNNYHIPLSDEDLFKFEAIKELPENIETHDVFSFGMSILENDDSLKWLDENMQITNDLQDGSFNTTSIINFPNGINSNELNKIIEVSRKTKQPLSKLMKEYVPNVSILTEIMPGEDVPKITPRN